MGTDLAPDDGPIEVRQRILDAAVAEAGLVGLGRMTVDGVARRAGVARATVYRHFPGGRDEVTAAAVQAEVARYFLALSERLDGIEEIGARLEEGIVRGRVLLAEHQVFQKVADTEPERLLPHLSQSAPLVLAAVRDHIEPLLAETDLAPGTDVGEAAEFLARNVLSFLMTDGGWDLDDRDQVHRLVHDHLLAGIVA